MRIARTLVAASLAASIVSFGCGPSNESAGGGAVTPAVSASVKPPIGFLNTPTEGQVIKSDSTKPLFGTGWALADSGVADVSVLFDDGQKTYVKLGFPFPGVKEQFPNYPDADKAGYMFGMPKLSPGRHSLVITVRAKDGATSQIERHFTMS